MKSLRCYMLPRENLYERYPAVVTLFSSSRKYLAMHSALSLHYFTFSSNSASIKLKASHWNCAILPKESFMFPYHLLYHFDIAQKSKMLHSDVVDFHPLLS